MRPTWPPVVLASASPRRLQLLATAGVVVTVMPTDIDETPHEGESPADLVHRLACEKAAASTAMGALVIAADTTVALGSVILNKPLDDDDARRMLHLLSGRRHSVFTGWCVRDTRGVDAGAAAVVVAGVVETGVVFRELDDDDISAWLATGEHLDKAGAYGIQGAAAALVATVDGSLTNVIGLPVDEVLRALRARTMAAV